MSDLMALTPREASIFACVTDTIVAPEPALPAVSQHGRGAVLRPLGEPLPAAEPGGPARAALRGGDALRGCSGSRARLRRLSEPERADALERAQSSGAAARGLTKVVEGLAFLSYYGDDSVMRRLGYDADANVARARELRAREGRP